MDTIEDRKKEKRTEFQTDNNIGKLKRRMYSRERKGFLPWRSRKSVKEPTSLVERDWDYESTKQKQVKDTEDDIYKNIREKPRNRAIPFLIFSIIFFIIAGIATSAYLYLALGLVSANEVDVTIEGKSAIASGEVLELQVLVSNRNDEPLEMAYLEIEYPDGTVSTADFITPLDAETLQLGQVEARSARRGTLRAILFGNTGDRKEIKVELLYRLQGGNAIHSRKMSHVALMTSDAISISVDANQELTPGQNIPMHVTVKSHAGTIIRGVYLDAIFPFGFTLLDSSPAQHSSTESSDNKARFLVGTLRPGEERDIYLSGTIEGQDGDNRIINLVAGFGTETDTEDNNQDTILAQTEHMIEVRKPFLSASLKFNGVEADKYIAKAGQNFDVTVAWHSNLSETINDATIAITIGGLALDKTKVNAGQAGFYRSVDSLILWDSKTSREKLSKVAPGDSGEFTFRLAPLPGDYLQQVRSMPSLTFAVHVAGKRLGEQGVPEVLKEDSSYEVKVGPDVTLTAYSLFHDSPFGALGPLPPRVEYETTYGVVWEVANTTSDIADTVVRAELPHYVRWVGLTSPASEQLIYNRTDNTIEWDLGVVKSRTGPLYGNSRRVTFALGLVPSATQIGSSPDLVRNQILEAIDTYTEGIITTNTENVDIRIINDSGFNNKDVRVVE